MITDDVINEIKEKADIVEVVSDYIKLEKAGSNYKGLCPFHNDSNPSFFVSPSKGIASCFVCKKGGDVISILEKLANITYMEAVKRLAKRYGVKLDLKSDYEDTRKISNTERLLGINKYTANFYNYYLNNSLSGKEALEYLHNRGFDKEIIEKFKIGLAPSGKNTLYLTLQDQGYKDNELESSGVILKSSDGYIHDMFINRIMFPIIDSDNQVLGFSGRIYKNQDGSKYTNTGETPLFKKGSIVYNLNNALDGIRKNHRIIIMEGFMDVIQSYKAGLTECVCLMGTALTKDHLPLLKKHSNRIVMCLDGDDAGQDNTIKSLKLLNSYGFETSVAVLPEGLDPDEYIKKYGNEKFLDIFENLLLDSYTFRYEYFKKKQSLNNFVEIQSFESNIFQMISKSNNQGLIESFLKRMSDDLNITLEAINHDFESFLSSMKLQLNVDKPKKVINHNVNNGTLTAYETLIRYMLTGKYDYYRISHTIDSITGLQANYIPDFMPTQLITLIYVYYNLDTNDKYFFLYYEFISKIEEYFRFNDFMDIDKFLNGLTANLRDFYNERISRIIITDERKKDKEIKDCYTALACFIINFGIKKFDELIKNPETYDKTQYIDQKILLKRELINVKRSGFYGNK